MVSETTKSIYGNKVRVRVCGLLVKDTKLLVLNHTGLNSENSFWSPPGGGIEFGESIEDCLKREFKEEVNLNIQVKDFLFITEHIHDSLHAVELFYHVESNDTPSIGLDPEIPDSFIKMEWKNQKDLDLLPNSIKHSVFQQNPTIIQYIIEKR